MTQYKIFLKGNSMGFSITTWDFRLWDMVSLEIQAS